MSSSPPVPRERRPANLAALQQSLVEIAARAKAGRAVTKEKPGVGTAPVLVVRGK